MTDLKLKNNQKVGTGMGIPARAAALASQLTQKEKSSRSMMGTGTGIKFIPYNFYSGY